MKKKLVVFCDGTWNDLRMADRTNVSRLAKCVALAKGPVPQVVFYDEGVGVGMNISKVADDLVRKLGGAFGRGLDRKIEDAYRFLVLNYEPGDDVYVFGFSRGAYTARSLCGLIRKCGILKRECVDKTPEAMSRYRDMKHPRDPDMIDFRHQYAHAEASGIEDHERLSIAATRESVRLGARESREELYQYRPERTYRMMFLGLWDTVGSLGVPLRFRFLQRLNDKYKFHDTKASSLLASIRHAVAANEDRRVFNVTKVDNVHELNQAWATSTGWNVDDPTNGRYVPYPHRPYQQRWFPGDHGAVGGGNPERGLSSSALLWVAEGARHAGLEINEAADNELGEARRLINPCAEWRINKDGTRRKPGAIDLLGEVGGFLPRIGPCDVDEVSETTYERWCRDPEYRVGDSGKVLSVLKGDPPPAPSNAPPPLGFPSI